MRLSLDLSKFYTDHRKLAYIFVNEKTMPLIQDVEKRIAGIFNISDFYLMQHDHYLPPLEEISILIDDCDVRAIPFDQVSIASDTCTSKKKKKKKKKTMEELFEVEPDDVFKKTRKRKFTEENHINDEPVEKSDKTNDVVVKKKSKTNESENELSKNNTGYFSYTKPRETFQEHLHKILIKEDEIIKRPPNIVKTIIVTSTNPTTTDNKTVMKDTDTDSSSDSSTSEQNEIVKEPKRRRRRRTRIRKKKTMNNEETMPQQLNDTDNTPKLTLPKPTVCHIRFSDDGKTNGKLSEKQPDIVENGNIVKDPVQDNTIKDDFILKQPLLVDISPKINDIIAFKTLRLNEKYLPELSPFIIGKVIAFNSDDKQITFDIKQGLDYCLPPQGKFFMEVDGDEGKTTEHSFKWTDLVEPRLIYP